jgi:thioredoxin-disulfide reductase
MKDLIIIGGGPAGLTAGIYGARKNLDTLLLTDNFIGQMGNAGIIENWPGEREITGPELIDNFKAHLDGYGVNAKEERVLEVNKQGEDFKVKTEENLYQAKAIIVATGRKPRKLNIPGEEKFVGKGVSYCVTCDGALFRDKKVVIIGGGNAGLEGALELADYTEKVTVLEIAPKLQADEYLIDRVSKLNNVEIKTEAEPQRIKGDGFVSSITYKDIQSEEKGELEVEGIFVEIGAIPNTNFLDDLVEFNKRGEIKINKKGKTKTEGLFGAGDVTDVRDKQIVVATGEGCKALLSAYNYIKK